jgi:hypothetical protein
MRILFSIESPQPVLNSCCGLLIIDWPTMALRELLHSVCWSQCSWEIFSFITELEGNVIKIQTLWSTLHFLHRKFFSPHKVKGLKDVSVTLPESFSICNYKLTSPVASSAHEHVEVWAQMHILCVYL